LLRALQEREIVRVGGTEPIPVDFRLISATHRDLAECVAEGRFREDLYFRIMGLTIVLPPLRHRQNDVLVLAKHFAEQYAKTNKTSKYRFSDAAKAKLKKHDYPGNVRELKACVELACVMSEDFVIDAHDISFVSSPKSNEPWDTPKTIKEIEREAIQASLKRNHGNVLRAAVELDIAKSKIYQYMKLGVIQKEK
jgi:DNA-binding NtrC family response regulator